MNRTFLFNPNEEVHIRTEDRDYELADFEEHPCWIYRSTGWLKSVKYEYRDGAIHIDWDDCEEHEVPESIRMKLLLLRS